MLTRIVIYTKKRDEMIDFYTAHFGFEVFERDGDRIVELIHPEGGACIMLHAAARSQKMGQVLVKLGFDVADVAAARDALIGAGVSVGPVLDGMGYEFANLKDPSGNNVTITGRHLVSA